MSHVPTVQHHLVPGSHAFKFERHVGVVALATSLLLFSGVAQDE